MDLLAHREEELFNNLVKIVPIGILFTTTKIYLLLCKRRSLPKANNQIKAKEFNLFFSFFQVFSLLHSTKKKGRKRCYVTT